MRHVILTCKNHPNLRWSCKEIAFDDAGGYNGSRSIFFTGVSTGKMHSDGSGLDCSRVIEHRNTEGQVERVEYIVECDCSPRDLIRAPEDALVVRQD